MNMLGQNCITQNPVLHVQLLKYVDNGMQ